MSSRSKDSGGKGKRSKSTGDSKKHAKNVVKPIENLTIENSVYDPSTSFDISVKWDTSSGSSRPQLILDGSRVVSPLPLKSTDSISSSKDDPTNLLEWAIGRVSKYEKTFLKKKFSDTVSFEFKHSSATDASSDITYEVPSLTDENKDVHKKTEIIRESETHEDGLILVTLIQTDIVWLLDIDSLYVTNPEDEEIMQYREKLLIQPEYKDSSTQLYRVSLNGLDDDEYKLNHRGVQVSRPKVNEATSQCTIWDIYDCTNRTKTTNELDEKTISSITRIERAVSWNSFGAGILRVTGQNKVGLPSDLSPVLLPLPFAKNRALVSCIVWHPTVQDLLGVGYSVDGQAVGAVDCWTLKNCSRPERRYQLNRPVMSLAFSHDFPTILVAETSLGIYLADIRHSENSWFRFMANSSDFSRISGSILPYPAQYVIGDKGLPIKIYLNNYQNLCNRIVYEPSGEFCLGYSVMGDIFLYSSLCPNRKKLAVFKHHNAPIVALNWANKSMENTNRKEYVFVSSCLDSTLALWNIALPEKPVSILQTIPISTLIDSDCLWDRKSCCIIVAAVTPDNLLVWKIPQDVCLNILEWKNSPRTPTIIWSISDLNPISNDSTDKIYFACVSLLAKGSSLAVGLSDGRIALFPLCFSS